MASLDYEYMLRKLIGGKYYGNFKSLFQGSGLEKKDIRHYDQGDDAKFINRKVSAKHNDLYVNTFHSDKDTSIQIFFDVNKNRSGCGKTCNMDLIIQYYMDLVIYCLKKNVNVECIYYDQDELVLTNIGKDKVKAHAFIVLLKKHIIKQGIKYISNYSRFVDLIMKEKKRRGIVVFSDFLAVSNDDWKVMTKLQLMYPLFFFRVLIDETKGLNYDRWILKPAEVEIKGLIDIKF